MSLNLQLRETIKMLRDELPDELNTLIEQGAGEISALDIVERALKPGDKAPEFSLKDRAGNVRTLQSYLDGGPLVLTFYRGIWCPYCNLQLAAYNNRLDDITAAGGTVIAVTPESETAAEALEESDMPQEAKDGAVKDVGFDVLHDADVTLATKYGLVFELPDAHKKLLEMMKLDIEKANGKSSYAFADPATYIIGTDGIIKWAYVPNNYRKRAEPDAIIEQLNKL